MWRSDGLRDVVGAATTAKLCLCGWPNHELNDCDALVLLLLPKLLLLCAKDKEDSSTLELAGSLPWQPPSSVCNGADEGSRGLNRSAWARPPRTRLLGVGRSALLLLAAPASASIAAAAVGVRTGRAEDGRDGV